MDKYKKLEIIFYLSFPFVALWLFSVSALYLIGLTPSLFWQYALIFSLAFTLAFSLQFLTLYKEMFSRAAKTNALQNAIENQEQSAKMLVRKDLELIRANEKLRELDAIKSNFISVAAHQLRTPLTAIKWTINLIMSESLGPLNTKQRAFLMKSYESNERMIALINDMLTADRTESDKLQYQFTSVQILDLIDNVLYEMVVQADKQNVKIEMENRDINLPRVKVDAEKIRAVLQNLFENAIKYTPAGGKILVKFSKDAKFVQVSIKDSGIGIPEDQQKNVFNRFFRAPNAVKVQTDGSGLGLFITKNIIEKHGGKIWFESAPGKGTTFYFTVPLAN